MQAPSPAAQAPTEGSRAVVATAAEPPGKVMPMAGPRLGGLFGCWALAAAAALGAWHLAPPDARGPALMAAAALGVAASVGLEVLRWRRTGRQLQRYIAQIDAAGQGELCEQPTPTQPEWVGLSRALNVMVERLRAQIAQRDERLQVMTDVVMHDPLTQLPSRTRFSQVMGKALAGDAKAGSGVLLMVRLRELPALNQRLGRAQGDELLKSVATSLRVRAVTMPRARLEVFRMNGADFAVLGVGVDEQAAQALLAGVSAGLQQLLGSGWDLPEPPAWVSGCPWLPGETVTEVLTRVDGLLQICEAEERPTCWRTPGPASTRLSPTQWRDIIDTALETGRIGIALQEVLGTENGPAGLVHHQRCQVSLSTTEGKAYPAAEFLPAARRVFRLDHLELRAIELVLVAAQAQAQAATAPVPVLVSVSLASALRPSFIHRLGVVLQAAPQAAQCLWLALEAPGLAAQLNTYAPLLGLTARLGVRSGLQADKLQLDMLAAAADMGLSFVRLDAKPALQAADGARRGASELQRIYRGMAQDLGIEVLPHETGALVLTPAEQGSRAPGLVDQT